MPIIVTLALVLLAALSNTRPGSAAFIAVLFVGPFEVIGSSVLHSPLHLGRLTKIMADLLSTR